MLYQRLPALCRRIVGFHVFWLLARFCKRLRIGAIAHVPMTSWIHMDPCAILWRDQGESLLLRRNVCCHILQQMHRVCWGQLPSRHSHGALCRGTVRIGDTTRPAGTGKRTRLVATSTNYLFIRPFRFKDVSCPQVSGRPAALVEERSSDRYVRPACPTRCYAVLRTLID